MPETTDSRQIIDDFHRLSYEVASEGRSWGGATYMGVKTWKLPSDLQLYQELIWTLEPRLIVETGTAFGGSALYFAHLLDQVGYGKVVSVDLNEMQQSYPRHVRIAYVGGRSSVHPESIAEVRGWMARYPGPNLIILDSDHKKGHVLNELKAYSAFVQPNSWLVVEDTNVGPNDMVFAEHGPGPGDALREWLPKNPEFKLDEAMADKYLYSYHSWLRRRRG